MTIEIVNNSILDLVERDAEAEMICTGFQFTEGPIWHPVEQCLYFSDMPSDIRRRWSPKHGVSGVRNPSNKCNGMTLDGDGSFIVCEHSTSLVVRENVAGEREILASHWQGSQLNSPNDVVVGGSGTIYFTDPSYGRLPVFGLEREQELAFQGLFRIALDGTLALEVDDFGQPNGLCFSPDQSRLFVNDSERAHIRVFDVVEDGSLTNGRLFFEGVGDGQMAGGIVDGMKCDEHGNIYVTGPRGLWVISSTAELLGVITLPEHAGNLNWGGPHWRDLYCACSTSIYRISMKVRGNHSSYMASQSLPAASDRL